MEVKSNKLTYETLEHSISAQAQAQNEIQAIIQPFGLKYEATARGYRIHVSVHCETIEECRKSALDLLLGAESDLRSHSLPIARS